MIEIYEQNKSTNSMESKAVFLLVYLALASSTYVLPYLGSNSALFNFLTLGFNPAFWLHFSASVALVVICYLRGRFIASESLFVIPLLALLFDFAPVLNWIPFVPSALHLLAISIGALASDDMRAD